MKKRFLTKGKLILAMALLAGMSGMGVTYSLWNTGGSITSNLRTGKFSMVFSEPEKADYTVTIVDSEGNTLEEMPVDVLVYEDGKSAGLRFQNGLPLELLVQGNYIRIEYPFKPADDGTVTGIEITEANLDSDGEILEMTATSGELVVDGNTLGDETVPEPFMAPLEFHVYRGTAEEQEELYGNIYLRMTEACVERVGGLPEMIELAADALDGAGSYEGFLTVTYDCEITFYLNQKEAGVEQEDGWRD